MSTAPESMPTPSAPTVPTPHSLMERLLSPQGIQALLGTGGALFVGGMITWLATLGIFDHPLVLAATLGGVNLALLLLGFWLVLSTRYQLAGLALTLLACLVMPLHLWFYHAQKLLTFDNHLWAAGLVISLLYALTARVLRNIWFVPIFLGGIAMTVLLILADMGQFWQITAPAIAMCLIGIVAIHAERLFTQDETSPFRRERFGLAFFWSGHALLGLGLLMVLVAQLAGGPLYATYTKSIYQQWQVTPTDLVTTSSGKLIALFLVLAAIYAHLYSDMVVRRKGYYLQIAALLLVWVEFLIIDLLNINLRIETLLGIVAATGLLLQMVDRYLGHLLPRGLPVLPFLGTLLTIGTLLAGMFYYFADGLSHAGSGVNNPGHQLGQFVVESRPILLLSMIIAGVAQAVGYYTSKHPYQRLYQTGLSLAAILIPALLVSIYGPATWFAQAGIIMVLGIVAVVLAWREPVLRDLGVLVHLFVIFWLLLGLPHLFYLGTPDFWPVLGVLLSASVFYFLAAQLLHQKPALAMGILCVLLALLHIFAWFDFALPYKMAACTLLGAGLILLSGMVQTKSAGKEKSNPIGTAGKVVFFISVLATMLLSVQTLVVGASSFLVWPIFNALLLEAVLAGLFYWTRKNDHSRSLFFACAITNVVLAGILLVMLMDLTLWRKMELAAIGLGMIMTVSAFRAWSQETTSHRHQNSVSPLFLLGTLLICVPLALVVMSNRSSGHFLVMDEAAMLIIGLLLLGAGCICQLRIPAIAGAVLTVLYLAGLLLFVPWGQLGTAALILAGGGAGLFLLGLGLSIFRDRLLALPQQVKDRKGIFQVLGWR
ncbi:MAG TPA: hypothetical protein PLN21_05955 [Gemmatales bacterium]|nr:hypothetical protein [Gemmatales bacterium]